MCSQAKGTLMFKASINTSEDWSIDSTTACKGVRLKYQGNVLYSSAHRTTLENLEACCIALAFLLDLPIDDLKQQLPELKEHEGLTIDAYKSS